MIVSQNWKQLASIQIGGAICLPMIMVGHVLGQTYGLFSACVAIVGGNAILLGLALLMFNMSYPHKSTTMEQASKYFGNRGILLLAFAMAFSMLGWFGIQLNVMSESLQDMLSLITEKTIFSPIWINVVLGLIITAVALYGIQGINQLANFSLPILILTLGYALYMQEEAQTKEQIPFSWKGISLVLAAAIAAVIDLPTYFRHATSSKDGWISLILTFGLALPVIEAIGVYLSIHGGGEHLVDHLKSSTSFLWNTWIALFLVLAGWTTNNTNLYSGAISLNILLPKWSEKKRMICLGLTGTLLSCLNLLGHFETVLDVLGLLLASMGAVVLARALLKPWFGEIEIMDSRIHLQAWIAGIVIGLSSLCQFLPGTAIPTLDTFLATLVVTLILLIKKEYYEKINVLRT